MKNKLSRFAVPYEVWMAIFVVAPIVIMVAYAFSSADGGFTMDNFVQMGGYTEVFLRSFKLAIIATVICLLIGYPVSYLMSREGASFQRTAMVLIMLPMWTVIIKLDHSLLEAARDLGAGSLTVFRRVILPLSLPGVVTGITMVFVPSVSTFAISRMLGGGTELLLGDLIERQFLGGAYNPQLGAAISLVMMIIVLVCMLVMNRFGEGEEQAVKL